MNNRDGVTMVRLAFPWCWCHRTDIGERNIIKYAHASPTTRPAHQLRDKKDGESPFVQDWRWQENLSHGGSSEAVFWGGHFGGRFSRCCLFIWIKVLGTVGCHGFGLVGTIMASGRPDITHNHYAIIIHLLSMLVFPMFVS